MFVVHTYSSFVATRPSGDRILHLVMDYAPRDLFACMRTSEGTRIPFNEDDAKFIGAQILLALSYLHGLGIAHRDVKPENVLVGADGYLLLSDFGVSSIEDPEQRSRSIDDSRKCALTSTPSDQVNIVGTEHYHAPEIAAVLLGVQAREIGALAADSWAAGVVLYELLCAKRPFDGEDIVDVYESILAFAGHDYPDSLSADACSLLRGFLKESPSERFTCTNWGPLQFGRHAWFESFPFDQLQAKLLTPPLVCLAK